MSQRNRNIAIWYVLFTPALVTVCILPAIQSNRQRSQQSTPSAAVRSDSGSAVQVDIVSWNVEYRESEPESVVDFIKDFPNHTAFEDCEVFGLCEVHEKHLPAYTAAAESYNKESRYKAVCGESSNNGFKLAIIYDCNDLKLDRHFELRNLPDSSNSGRAPLVCEFKHLKTGVSFFVVMNHLLRGNAAQRAIEARNLSNWIAEIDVPVICMGDFNFDWDIRSGKGNEAFQLMTADSHWTWVKPPKLVKTQASPKFNSVLDFIFINDDVIKQEWRCYSEIIVRDGDFPDTEKTPDHRPVYGRFLLPRT